jgi:hypothetical protein
VWLGALAGIAAAVIVVWLRAAWRRRGRSRIAVARARRALAGEREAEALLADAGYAVTARQARRAWQVRLDGEPIDIDLRADLLAEADGRTYVAEVKTGAAAPRIDTAATRRQLLEYQVAYGVDGVLLVDAEAGAVRVVDFPEIEAVEAPPKTPRRPGVAWIAVAAALAGFAAGRWL